MLGKIEKTMISLDTAPSLLLDSWYTDNRERLTQMYGNFGHIPEDVVEEVMEKASRNVLDAFNFEVYFSRSNVRGEVVKEYDEAFSKKNPGLPKTEEVDKNLLLRVILSHWHTKGVDRMFRAYL